MSTQAFNTIEPARHHSEGRVDGGALFAAGCALRNYKPLLVRRMYDFLLDAGIVGGEYVPCCKAEDRPEGHVTLVNCCPGCAHKFDVGYPTVTPVSLWRALLDTDFPFPDYRGQTMAIHDACHARGRHSSEMQAAARALCERMNIRLVEPVHTRDETVCCGGSASDYETRRRMALQRALELKEDNVVVYCTGCVRSFSLTSVHPRHLLDLLYEEPTEGLTVARH